MGHLAQVRALNLSALPASFISANHLESHFPTLTQLLLHAGKTLLAKAVANQTSATFLRVVGSELIQKYLGDGPKLVRELFRVAEEHAPSIVFIDEIDAIGTKRYFRLFLSGVRHKGHRRLLSSSGGV